MTLAELAAQHRDHSIFAPSSAGTWARCAGSLVASAMAPDRPTVYAAEGSVAHMIADEWLRSGERPTHRVGTVVMYDGFAISVDDNMLAYVEQYVDWVKETGGEFESKVDFSEYMPIPNQKGTADHYYATFGSLIVTDLKYGQGIKVYAADNYQLLLYALGVFLLWDWYYDFQTITVRICQPRLDHFDGHVVSRADLLQFADWIRGRSRLAWAVDAPRTPGEKQCEGCNRQVRGSCPAYLLWFAQARDNEASDVFGSSEGHAFEVVTMIAAAERAADPFEPEEPIVLPELSIEAWARIFPMRKAVEKWFADGEARLFAAALIGEAPGYKVVEGRSNRTWIDEEKAKVRMIEVGVPEDETENHTLKSPNQIEEYLHGSMKMPKTKAKGLFESHTERKDGGLSLVRSADKREAVPDHGSVFDGDE